MNNDSKPVNDGELDTVLFENQPLDDVFELVSECEENLSDELIQSVTIRLIQFMVNGDVGNAFIKALTSAHILDNEKPDMYDIFRGRHMTHAQGLCAKIKGLDEDSICSACMLVGYELYCNGHITDCEDIKQICPNGPAKYNIAIMVKRGVVFYHKQQKNKGTGFFDMSTSRYDFTNKEAFHLLLHWMELQYRNYEQFTTTSYLIWYNVRKNERYVMHTKNIPYAKREEAQLTVPWQW